MPPRKSNASVATNGDGETAAADKTSKQRDGLGVEDLNLPRTMIQRLAKGVLPSNTQIQKDALLAISKSSTVFVNYVAWNAYQIAVTHARKTIMPQDVIESLREQEFELFIPRVEAETAKYNEIQCEKRNTYRRTKKAEQNVVAGEDAMDESGDRVAKPNGVEEGDADGPPSKKVRREPGDEGAEDDVEEVIEDDDADEDEDEEEDEVEDEEEAEEEAADEPGGETEDGDDGGLNGMRDEALDEPDSD